MDMKSHYTPVSLTLILLSCFLLAFMRFADQSFFNQASQANLAEIAAMQDAGIVGVSAGAARARASRGIADLRGALIVLQKVRT